MKTVEIAICAGGSVLIAIGALVAYGTLRMQRKNAEAHKWPKVSGTILASEIETRARVNDGKRMLTHRAGIRYAYEVGGKRYESDQIQLGGSSESSEPEEYEAMVARYPEGRQVTVWYDPSDPATATLEPGAKGGIFNMAMVGGGFMLVGAVLVALTTLWPR